MCYQVLLCAQAGHSKHCVDPMVVTGRADDRVSPPPASVGPGRGGVLVVAVGLREIRALSPALGRADPIRVDSIHTGS